MGFGVEIELILFKAYEIKGEENAIVYGHSTVGTGIEASASNMMLPDQKVEDGFREILGRLANHNLNVLPILKSYSSLSF